MSVFGGDSWGREAQYRKRRVDDLLLQDLDASCYKKLFNGKFTCLVCPSSPVLDTLIMLTTHAKGSCHRAAELRRRDRELARQEEINKRIALSDSVKPDAGASVSNEQRRKYTKPLIERAQKVASEVVSGGASPHNPTYQNPVLKSEPDNVFVPRGEESGNNGDFSEAGSAHMGVVVGVQQLEHRRRRERELKFTAAGWKRSCHGRWFKDENVEFDSDEEDPNIVLLDSRDIKLENCPSQSSMVPSS